MIEDALKKYNIEPNKFYGTRELYLVLTEIGLIRMGWSSFTTDWMKRKMQRGEIVLQEKASFRYLLTGKQIEDIVKAFVPGGSGKYDYKDY